MRAFIDGIRYYSLKKNESSVKDKNLIILCWLLSVLYISFPSDASLSREVSYSTRHSTLYILIFKFLHRSISKFTYILSYSSARVLAVAIALRTLFINFNLDSRGTICTLFSNIIWLTMTIICVVLLREIWYLQIENISLKIRNRLRRRPIIRLNEVFRYAQFLSFVAPLLAYQLWMIVHLYEQLIDHFALTAQTGLVMPLITVPLYTVSQVYSLRHFKLCRRHLSLKHLIFYVTLSCTFDVAMIEHLASVMFTTFVTFLHGHHDTFDMCIGFVLGILELAFRLYSLRCCYKLWRVHKNLKEYKTSYKETTKGWRCSQLVISVHCILSCLTCDDIYDYEYLTSSTCTELNNSEESEVVTGMYDNEIV